MDVSELWTAVGLSSEVAGCAASTVGTSNLLNKNLTIMPQGNFIKDAFV